MKIAIASQTYDLKTNGQGVFSVHLAQGLAAAGHEVVALKPSETGGSYGTWQEGVWVHGVRAVSLRPFYPQVRVTLLADGEVRQALGGFCPDVIQIQDHYPLCRAATRIARQMGAPTVGTNCFLPDNLLLNVGLFNRFQRITRRILWGQVLDVFNRLDRVAAPTPTAAAIFRQEGMRPPVQAISCGVDLARFHRDDRVDAAAVRRKYGLDPDSTVFLYVGRLDGEKRLEVLIRAVGQAGRPDFQVCIAGRGERERELKDLRRELGLERQVIFTGFLPEEDHPRLLNSVDFFAMPGVAELQSLATLEALAAGRPALAAERRALPEIVHQGENGYLFRPDDVQDAAAGMRWLADHRDRWEEMSAASQRIAAPHAMEQTVQQYAALYREVVEEARRRGAG